MFRGRARRVRECSGCTGTRQPDKQQQGPMSSLGPCLCISCCVILPACQQEEPCRGEADHGRAYQPQRPERLPAEADDTGRDGILVLILFHVHDGGGRQYGRLSRKPLLLRCRNGSCFFCRLCRERLVRDLDLKIIPETDRVDVDAVFGDVDADDRLQVLRVKHA